MSVHNNINRQKKKRKVFCFYFNSYTIYVFCTCIPKRVMRRWLVDYYNSYSMLFFFTNTTQGCNATNVVPYRLTADSFTAVADTRSIAGFTTVSAARQSPDRQSVCRSRFYRSAVAVLSRFGGRSNHRRFPVVAVANDCPACLVAFSSRVRQKGKTTITTGPVYRFL